MVSYGCGVKTQNNKILWKDFIWSWVCRINIAKIAILQKAIYRFNTIHIKISTQLFTNLRTVLNFI